MGITDRRTGDPRGRNPQVWIVVWIFARMFYWDVSSSGYPGFGTDLWTEVLHQYRCNAVTGGRRCQLYRDHDDEHAHAERVSVKPWRSVAHCWDDERSWVEAEIKRRRWCCLFAQ
jgi:hypothetical protein